MQGEDICVAAVREVKEETAVSNFHATCMRIAMSCYTFEPQGDINFIEIIWFFLFLDPRLTQNLLKF